MKELFILFKELLGDKEKGFFRKCGIFIKACYYNETVRYLFMGVCTTLVNLISYWLFIRLFRGTMPGLGKNAVTISNVISIIIAILFAYVTNKLFVFESKTHGVAELFYEFLRFVGGRMLTMVIEVGGVYLIFNIMGWNEMVAKLITQVLVVIGNYFISKFLVFKGQQTE